MILCNNYRKLQKVYVLLEAWKTLLSQLESTGLLPLIK